MSSSSDSDSSASRAINFAFFLTGEAFLASVEEEEEDVAVEVEGAGRLTVDLVVLIGSTVLPLATSC